MRVLVAGGGSGGHLYPALAILEGFRARGAERLGCIGARRELEREVFADYPWLETFLIHGRGLPRRPSWRWPLALGELALGLMESLLIISRFRPTVIIGTGGFASFPPLFWGILLKIPTVACEVNVVPGLVSRWLAPRVGLALVAYPETALLLRAKRIAVTGLPLRPGLLEVARLPREELKADLGLDPRKRTVLVLGGSRGAAPLNRAIMNSESDRDGLQILLVTGRRAAGRGEGARRRGIIVREYLDRYEMGEALGAADLVISRAGAATLALRTALGRPALLVPWPGAAQDHQEKNARFLKRAGGALVLHEDLLEEIDLVELTKEFLAERERLQRMAAASRAVGRRDGLRRVIEEVERYLANSQQRNGQ
ncbi:MAG: glycosyltransferase [Candidatus Bipolaricaulia bacterium]